MKLGDLLSIIDENKRVDVYEKGKDGLIAQYNGKDSIPETFNDSEVSEFQDLGSVVGVSIFPKVPTLAERVDKAMHDYDIYAYQDNDVSAENVEHWIKDNPVGVIEDLLSIIEDYSEQIEALQVEAGYGYKKEDK